MGSVENGDRRRTWLGDDMDAPEVLDFAGGQIAAFTVRSPTKDPGTTSEDALGLFELGPDRAVIAVADGAGGQPRGEVASALAIEAIGASVASFDGGESLRAAILDGFESAQSAIVALGVGAGTTLLVAEVIGDWLRSYHVGDSHLFVTGSRGKVHMETMPHSPVGYAVEAGILDEQGAMAHEDRHIVSNLLGAPDMRIDIGPRVRLQARDTVVLGSDGLFDNLRVSEVVALVRGGKLAPVAAGLAAQCRARMMASDGGPGHADDLTFALFRRGAAPAVSP